MKLQIQCPGLPRHRPTPGQKTPKPVKEASPLAKNGAHSNSPVSVLVVADESDAHGKAILNELASQGHSAFRFNLSDIRSDSFTFEAGQLRLGRTGEDFRVSSSTAVWWRRLGTISTRYLEPAEARLVQDEAPHILRGALAGCGVEWVDDPFVIARAETKLLQLAVAHRLGLKTPPTLLTDSRTDAAHFLGLHGRAVAKALSGGIGIAPFVGEIETDDLGFVATNPVLLQARIDATADLRVVTVADQAWAWRRPRHEGTTDWRRDDPSGAGFMATKNADHLIEKSLSLASGLGLTMSAQDWLETTEDAVFLECNPQGAWLFLKGAREVVVPATAKHLASRRTGK